MSFWVYKCNTNSANYHRPEWQGVFGEREPTHWGNTRKFKLGGEVRAGDVVIAYQTDRNELVGLAEVVEIEEQKGDRDNLVLRPIEQIGVKLAPLKKLDARIRGLSAFKKANIATLYRITTVDAWHLLNVARAQAALNKATTSKE